MSTLNDKRDNKRKNETEKKPRKQYIHFDKNYVPIVLFNKYLFLKINVFKMRLL